MGQLCCFSKWIKESLNAKSKAATLWLVERPFTTIKWIRSKPDRVFEVNVTLFRDWCYDVNLLELFFSMRPTHLHRFHHRCCRPQTSFRPGFLMTRPHFWLGRRRLKCEKYQIDQLTITLTVKSYNKGQGRPQEFSQHDEIIGPNYSHYIYKNTSWPLFPKYSPLGE